MYVNGWTLSMLLFMCLACVCALCVPCHIYYDSLFSARNIYIVWKTSYIFVQRFILYYDCYSGAPAVIYALLVGQRKLFSCFFALDFDLTALSITFLFIYTIMYHMCDISNEKKNFGSTRKELSRKMLCDNEPPRRNQCALLCL